MRIEAFLPSRHGFSCVLPPVEGDDFGLATSMSGVFGLSAGMVWLALDRYLAGRPVPAAPASSESDDVLRTMVRRRQEQALARTGWQMLREWQALPDRGVPGRPGLAERSRAEFRELRRSLDAGVPVMLYLVLAEGRHADPSRNHAVLAYGYEVDRRARRASVRVYDPARPGNDGLRLVFQTTAGRALEARLAVQTPVRGFLCVPYDRPLPARITLNGVAADDTRIAEVLAVWGQGTDGAGEALARSATGGLVHVRRRRSGGYAAEAIEVDVLNGSDVEQATFSGSGRLVLWTKRGELIDCRRRPGLGWRGRRITDTRTHGRIDGITAVVPRERGRVSLFACGSGRLLQFRRGRLPGWEAEHIDAGPLARAACTGSPAGVRLGSAMHVVARTRGGELMHARWRGRQGWVAENVTARAGDRERFLVVDDPILLADGRGRSLSVVGRSKNGALLLFRWTERKGWRALDLSAATGPGARDALRSDSVLSAAIESDGTVHAVGRTADGGLLHGWCTRSGAAGVHELTRSRPLVGDAGRIDGTPVVVATPADAVHVVARRDTDLLLFRWAEHADWSVENVSAERERPRVTQDPRVRVSDDVAHVGLLDMEGRVQHVTLQARAGGGRRLHVPGIVIDVLLLPLTLTGLLADAITALMGGASRMRAANAAGQPLPEAPADTTTGRHPVRAEVLPRLRDADEDAPAAPLPLLDEVEAPAHAEHTAPAAIGGGGIGHDDWNWDAPAADPNGDLFERPLSELPGAAEAVASATQQSADDEAGTGLIDLSLILPARPTGPTADEATPTTAAEPVPAPQPVAAAAADSEPVASAKPEPAAGTPASASIAEAAPAVEPDAAPAAPPESLAGAAAAAEPDAAPAVPAEPVAEAPLAAESGAKPAPAVEPVADITHAAEATPPAEPVADLTHAAEVDAPSGAAMPGGQTPAGPGRGTPDLIVVYPEPESGHRPKTNGKPAAAQTNGKPATAQTNGKPAAAQANGRSKSPADGRPGTHGKAPPLSAERRRIAFPPEFESSTDAADSADAAPVEPLPLLDAGDARDASPPDLPRLDAADADDWNEPLLPESPGGADWSLPDPLAGPGDDWILPADARAAETAAAADDDWNLPPEAAPAVPTPLDDARDAGLTDGSADDLVLAPIEGLEQQTDAAPDATGEDLQLPPVEGLVPSDAAPIEAPEPWAATPVEGLETEEIATGGTTPQAASIADTDDDWNLPEDAPVATPEPMAGPAEAVAPAAQPDSHPSEPASDPTLELVQAEPEPAVAPPDTEPPAARRKWNNPALEGLPLLDDDEPAGPGAREPRPPTPAKPPARRKPKKTSANDMERLIALAEANQPELLPPD